MSKKTFGTGYLRLLVGLTGLMVSVLAFGTYAARYRATHTQGLAVVSLLSTAGDRPITNFSDLHLYSFDASRMTMALFRSPTRGRWIRVETHDPDHSRYLGIAMVKDMPVDETGVLEIDWRIYEAASRLEFNLIERDPVTSAKGEHFRRPAGDIEDGWTISRFPITSFFLNDFHRPVDSDNKVMDPERLMQLDIGIIPGPDATLDIRGIRMLWDPGRRWLVGGLGAMAALLLLQIPGTFKMRIFDAHNPKGIFGTAVTARLTLTLTILLWGILFLRDRPSGSLVSNLILAGGTVLVCLPGAFSFIPPIRHRLWGLRNFAVWAVAIAAGYPIGIIQALFATIIILLPAVESRDRRIIAINATGIVIGIFTTLPFEFGGNRFVPALIFAALLLLGVVLVERILFPAFARSSASILKLYEGLFHYVPDGIFICANDFRLLTVNPGFEALTGKRKTEVEGKDLRDFLMPEDRGILEALWEDGTDSRTVELRFLAHDGTRSSLTRIQRLQDRGEPYGFQAIATDITRQKELEEKLRSMNEQLYGMSMQDSLTGIANRRMFDQHLEREWLRACRHSSVIALVLLDIDHFKAYNDTYGHPTGDQCLRLLAEELSRFGRRSGELLVRHGGEEFALILPQIVPSELQGICQQIIQAVDDLGIPHSASPVGSSVTISVGATWRQGTYDSIGSLVSEADEALYDAKHQGRHRAVVRVPPGLSGPDAGTVPAESSLKESP